MGNTLVIVEPNQDASMQMFTAAKELGGDVHALVLGTCDCASVLPCSTAYQVAIDRYTPLAATEAIAKAIELSGATTVLIAATQIGRDVAPRVAAKCGGALLGAGNTRAERHQCLGMAQRDISDDTRRGLERQGDCGGGCGGAPTRCGACLPSSAGCVLAAAAGWLPFA